MQLFSWIHKLWYIVIKLSTKVWWKVKETIFNTYKFSNHDNNKFILLLRKGVYLYEYMGDWEKLNKNLLAEKENFYKHLNMEEITDGDFEHVKKVIVSWCIWEISKSVF